ncbi:MAG TPA: hypothetical protein VKG62_06975 [Solirubrobacteraceae bacterium]|nr:hypothetical protein [Solirubrobacteraceae bacterium]
MILALSEASVKTVDLAATFIGIGIVVGIISVYIAVQIRGERQANQEYILSRRPPGPG